MKFLSTICLIVSFLALSQNTFSQSGQLYGKIIDTQTNEELVGAKLHLTKDIVVYSDLDGNFFIKDIPAGKYTIEINSLSYNEQTLKEIEIKADETLRLNIEVSERSWSLASDKLAIARK